VLRLSATDHVALDEVTGEIHDWSFDMEDVFYDASARTVVIPFRRWSYAEAVQVASAPKRRWWMFGAPRGTEWEAPWYRWYLRVEHAAGLEIDDDEASGGGDFVAIDFDDVRRVVTIRCVGGFVELRIPVDALRIQLEQTGEKLGRARYSTQEDPMFATGYTSDVLPL